MSYRPILILKSTSILYRTIYVTSFGK